MELEQQIALLVENAPADGLTPQVMEVAIAPILKAFASQLKHLEYYVLQTIDGEWVLTTLSNRAQQSLEKNVIYAFATLKDAASFQGTCDPQVIASPVPVTHILFQMFAIEKADSTVFVETPSNLSAGVEVRRTDLQKLIQAQLKQFRANPNSLPPDIA